jgi:hypothetical protein
VNWLEWWTYDGISGTREEQLVILNLNLEFLSFNDLFLNI